MARFNTHGTGLAQLFAAYELVAELAPRPTTTIPTEDIPNVVRWITRVMEQQTASAGEFASAARRMLDLENTYPSAALEASHKLKDFQSHVHGIGPDALQSFTAYTAVFLGALAGVE